ncbi:MAG: TatD family hydrolase [Thermodesulfobacteriota bacterium]
MLIDSHAHLDMDEFGDDLPSVLIRALEAGIDQIVTVGIDLASSRRAVRLAEEHAFLFATVGCHPHNADKMGRDDLDRMAELASNPKVVAWGEIGLDFFRNRSGREGQIRAFERQLEIASSLDLPVVIHDRNAHEDVLSSINAMGKKRPRGVIHCFSGDTGLARTFLNLGYDLSLPGTVTFPKAETARDVARTVPLERLLVETDAPYLAPVPRRGRRNEPALLIHTAREIARLRGIPLEEAARVTSQAARRLFDLPEPASQMNSEES